MLAIDGTVLVCVTHRTNPLSLMLSGNHQESVQLFVIPSPLSPVVLGFPCWKRHNPHTDWSSASIINWSDFCHAHCLCSAIPAGVSSQPEPPEESDLRNVPCKYHDLQQVFSKDRTQSLPPHQPYDCAILSPVAPLTTKKLYNILTKQAMEKYITESLAAGLIHPSSSPMEQVFSLLKRRTKLSILYRFQGIK